MTAPVEAYAVHNLHRMGLVIATRLPAYVNGYRARLVAGENSSIPRPQAKIGLF